MRTAIKLCLISFVVFAASFALAAPKPSAAPLPEKYIELQKPELLWIGAGKEATVKVKVKVLPGLHVQSNPAALPNLKATTLSLPGAEGFEVKEAKYPEGKPYRMLNTAQDLSVYEGTFEISMPIKARSAKSGKHELKAELKYQACNDRICFFPRTEKFIVPVQVLKQ